MELKTDDGEIVSITASEQTSEALRRAADEIALEADARGFISPSVGGVAIEGAETESIPTFPTWEQQLEISGLALEEQELATNVRNALVEKYEGKDYIADDFSLIKTTREVDGKLEEVFTVILSATKPIDLGDPLRSIDPKRSWDSIVGDKTDKFILDAYGHKLDERTGITLEVMKEIAFKYPDINEKIWETGAPERAHALSAPFVDARMGVALRNHSHLRGVTSDNRDFVFRPAVMIAVHPHTQAA